MKRGDIVKAVITIIKVKRGVPSVIMVDGHRYVLDPISVKSKEVERK